MDYKLAAVTTCDWPQINCNLSAGHTLHYYDQIFDKTFTENLERVV